MDIDDVWQVVRDREGRYSVWRQGRPVPITWFATPFTGSRDECLAHIETVWRDPRPSGWARVMDNRDQTPGPR
ncbi:MbtH family NRPS accessory protein [Bradyrhizobium iriomotense]|uniref:Antibiotic synthesis protein MbtH n=1 Tax=Bradyrhizobium iriomotense TaxID=441950 RepID=A0ABQ6ANS1_9BRAD|nr:MbtH family NRPS accessory protein [Bradyrhizobium iriomotense]GLR83540.1 antibiotic synthesis protein MbtH [Bradyrhizobium iriomotense]